MSLTGDDDDIARFGDFYSLMDSAAAIYDHFMALILLQGFLDTGFHFSHDSVRILCTWIIRCNDGNISVFCCDAAP